MRARKFGRIVNITSAMVTTPRPGMALSSAARAGLTAALKGLSVEVAADNVTINNLLPERFDTDRQRFMAQRVMDSRRHQLRGCEESARSSRSRRGASDGLRSSAPSARFSAAANQATYRATTSTSTVAATPASSERPPPSSQSR